MVIGSWEGYAVANGDIGDVLIAIVSNVMKWCFVSIEINDLSNI